MIIEQKPILDVLGTPDVRFTIPVFQRVYSWTTRQCEELWDDIMRAGRAGKEHFMGLVLCCADPETFHGLSQLDVIDGQQRLTTLTLLLTALSRHVDEGDDIARRYLVVEGDGEQSPKLVLSGADRDMLAALVGAADAPEAPAQRLIDNCLLFADKMDEDGFDSAQLIAGLERLEVALVMLAPEDSPQLVFESLNSKGMPLSTADRVRNLIIASTDGEVQERLYTTLWAPMEETLAHVEGAVTLTDALHAWLVERYRSTRILDVSEVYGVFKASLRDDYDGSLERLLADLAAFVERFAGDAEFRAEAQKKADEWVCGKPEKSISEFKLFGD